ncbi:MAG: sulfatase-like hydrolase/transferase [Bryobacteraceae bacterium]
MQNGTRRNFLRTAGLGGLGLSQTLSSFAAQGQKPNILLMMADDLGYECLSCYGSTSYRTPRLDALAGSGVRFTHAYAQPLCTPTRIQLMTGLYNFRNWKAFGVMDPKAKTFGHIMRDAGYKTCIAGKWQLQSYNPPDFEPEWRGKGMRVEDAGFDEHCVWHAWHTEDKGSRYGDPTIYENGKLRSDLKGQYGEDIFSGFINSFAGRNQSQPFFAYFPMTLTHGPFMPTPHSAAWKAGNRLKNDPAHFKDMVEYMDGVVGRMVDNLDKLGLRERTLVLFYSDNGSPRNIRSRLGDRVIQGGKGLTTDAGMRVPFIANWKGVASSGKVNDDMIDSVDFLPTIAGAAGVSLPKNTPFDGCSFLPQVRGENGNPREWLFSHHDPRPGWDKKPYTLTRFARDKRFKLYTDGRFYDIPADVLEQKPIASGQGGEAESARKRLQAVLNRMPMS